MTLERFKKKVQNKGKRHTSKSDTQPYGGIYLVQPAKITHGRIHGNN